MSLNHTLGARDLIGQIFPPCARSQS